MRKIEEVMDDVAGEFGHFNWQCLLDNVTHGLVEMRTLTQIVTEVAKEYSRDAEKYYKQPECNCIEGKFDLDYREIARHEGFTAGYNEMRNKVKRDLDKLKRKIDQDEY